MAEWKLVPCEPSYDMKEAAWVASRDSDKPAPFNQLADGIAAALAATPPMPRAEWDAMVERAARAAVFKPGVLDIERMDRALRAALPGLQVEGEP